MRHGLISLSEKIQSVVLDHENKDLSGWLLHFQKYGKYLLLLTLRRHTQILKWLHIRSLR